MNGIAKATVLAIALLVFLPAISTAADTRVELRRNPFERPTFEVLQATAASSSTPSAAAQSPGLRAVLFAGPKSVVDFGGVIMQIGESANGYKLIAVEEGRATFRIKGKRVVFSLYEQDEGSEL
jgi:hypothetical protein